MNALLTPGARVPRSLTSRRRALLRAGVLVALSVASVAYVATVPAAAADSLPSKLSDQDYWGLISDYSEPNGFFRSDNLLSNESYFLHVVPELVSTVKPGGVYIGVGPEQNFTYIAAIKPAMVFIVDIRRGNMDLQLMYKALFELAPDRADFVSRLFSRKRPEGLAATADVKQIFAAFKNVEPSEEVYNQNLKAIEDHLVKDHKFPLLPDDLQGIEYVYRAFFRFGTQIQYSSTGSFGGSFQPSYADLMVATDQAGEMRSFLATDDNFRFMKDLHSKNLLVPIVGNFAGPRSIRSVGQYVKQRGSTVTAFYLSNVEQYLRMDGVWGAFCGNVATLPLDKTSRFIRSVRSTTNIQLSGLASELGDMIAETTDCSS